MIMKDKSNLPHYLQYRDRGFMYFPDFSFLPFLRTIHETVRGVASISSLEDTTIEVCDILLLKLFTAQLHVYCIRLM